MAMEIKDDALYTRADVINGLGICGETLRRHIAKRKFPKPATIAREAVWPGSVLRRHFENQQAKAEGKR